MNFFVNNPSSHPSSQEQILFNQFQGVLKELGEAYYFRPVQLALFLRYSLENNVHYKPSFWEQQDEEGNHAFLSLCKRSPIFFQLYDIFKKDAPHLISQTNERTNECLLHVAWHAFSKNTGIDQGILLPVLRDIQHHTPIESWTWLDVPTQQKGQGWINAILEISKKNNSSLNDIAEDIAKAFSHKPNSKSWLRVTSKEQAEVLYASGSSFNDELVLGDPSNPKTLPVWQYFVGSNRNSTIGYSIKNGDFPDVDATKIKEFQEGMERLDFFRPKDYRAKIGYVRSVLASDKTSPFGLNAAHYLMSLRGDLTPLLVQEMRALMSKNGPESLSHFLKEDNMGFSLLPHALRSLSNDHFGLVKKMYQDFGLPLDYHCQDKGWFAQEKDFKEWFEATSLNGHTVFPQVNSLATHLCMEELFGNSKQQQQWEQIWERHLPKLLDITPHQRDKKATLPVVLTRQLSAYLYNLDKKDPSALVGLSDTLSSQMTASLQYLIRINGVNEVLKDRSGSQRVTNVPDLPTVFTPSIQRLSESQQFSPTQGNRLYLERNKNRLYLERNKEWHVTMERFVIDEGLKDIKNAKDAKPRINKM